ncbi:hypothetical protein PRZ48_005633 [Zasmidium cellare]|uniref:Choline monooxygenase, chloroplastic n=1 Tax=Zasmidium cellare TaxID=395010 RepID=A0ABR0EN18_ZASCE|nr:hypothetical protein PRZ48_005633 [Zasmidium cellare]
MSYFAAISYTSLTWGVYGLAIFGLIMQRLLAYTLGWTPTTKGSETTSGAKTTSRALPADWYRSNELYDLERRAIFSRKWMLVSHKLRFLDTGNWIRFEEACFQFVIVKGRDGLIRGFHNVCRHRGFPIVTEESGQSKILVCKYHGWSYGLNGTLAKAPGYQDIEKFDRDSNSLLPVHVKVDAHGFVWVNLDAKEAPEVAWEADFKDIDQKARHHSFNFEDYKFDHTWQMTGDYNWKTLADNYNECYHCAIAHPDVSAVADLEAYKVETKGGNIEHFASTTPEQEKAGHKVVSNYYFPNACMTVTTLYVSYSKVIGAKSRLLEERYGLHGEHCQKMQPRAPGT